MKRFFSCLLMIAILISFAACGKQQEPPAETEAVTESQALLNLRAGMKLPVIAEASFGFPVVTEDFDIKEYLWEEYPKWMASHDFVADIEEDRIISTCETGEQGNLVCVVPYDPAATICVTVTYYLTVHPYEKTEEVYRTETGEPILLLASVSNEAIVSVEVTDSEGRGVSWQPYWGTETALLKEDYPGALAMSFTPKPEKTIYHEYLGYGWSIPDDSFLTDHFLQSSYGYQIQLTYHPEEDYDGESLIYETDDTGVYKVTYQGNWKYQDGKLELDMKNIEDSTLVIQDAFPLLADPYTGETITIFRTEDGVGLPQFFRGIEYDELSIYVNYSDTAYDYALGNGWREPKIEEMTDSFWRCYNYALELREDAVPGDGCGEAAIYEVDENGAYTQKYSGYWAYQNSLLYLSLLPKSDDGFYIDDTFPVLMGDNQLWLGRSETGGALPYFTEELYDIFDRTTK